MAEVALLVLEEIPHFLDRPGRHLAASDARLVHQREVDVEGWDQGHVALEHEVDPLVIDQIAVLDAGNAGPQSVLDAGRTFGVSERAADPGSLRLFDDGANLIDGELGRVGEVRGGPDSAGRHDLDPVRAGPDLEPRGASHCIGPIGDAGREIAHLGGDDRAGGGPLIAVAAGLGERLAADLGSGTRERARGEGPLDPRRGVARVTDGSDTALEELASGLETAHDDVRRRALDPVVDRFET